MANPIDPRVAPGSAPGVPYEIPGSTIEREPSAGVREGERASATEGAKPAAEQTAEQIKERGAAAISQQKESVAGQVEAVALALRRTAANLRGEGRDPVAKLAERAAEGIGRFSSSLRDQDLRGLVRRAEDFARREPALFLGGAIALGFVAARFLKSGPRGDEG